MAWSKLDAFGYVALAGATEVSVALDKRYSYKIIHTGDDVAGVDDANSAKTAWLSTSSGAITADLVFDEDEKMWLLTDTNVTLGPGIEKLYLVSTSDADAAIQIIRQGSYESW
jgi:hypothetical protein